MSSQSLPNGLFRLITALSVHSCIHLLLKAENHSRARTESNLPEKNTMPLEVIRVTTSEEFEIAKRLRYEVFALQLGFDPAQDLDKYDFMDTTVHLIGRDVETNEYVAVARCLVDPAKREAKIGRVGVLTKFQCRGYGGLIIAAIHPAVQARCDTISLGAMPDKVGFYRRLGYVRINDEMFLDDNGVELCWMTKNLDDNNTES